MLLYHLVVVGGRGVLSIVCVFIIRIIFYLGSFFKNLYNPLFHLGGISFVKTRKLSLNLPSWEQVNCNASQYVKD